MLLRVEGQARANCARQTRFAWPSQTPCGRVALPPGTPIGCLADHPAKKSPAFAVPLGTRTGQPRPQAEAGDAKHRDWIGKTAPPNALLRPRALTQISPWRAGASPREGPLFLAYARADLASSGPKPAIRNNRDRRSRGPAAPSGGTHCVFYCQPIPKQLLPGAQAEKPRSAANRAHRARESPPPHAARATRQSS